MAADEPADKQLVSLSNLPATPQQRRVVFAVALLLLGAFAITAPFASAQLPSFVSFNPAVEAMVFVNDLVTAILLFSQYSISRSRAILALAIGYLYTALIVIPHILVFPGAFTGLLAAGPQSSAWLYYFWTAGTPLAVIVYALLRNADPGSGADRRSTRVVIGWSVALVIALTFGLTWLTTAGHRFLPPLMSGDHYSNAVVYVANPLALLIAVVALGLLWPGRRSVLDYWLMLVMFSLVLNYVIAAYLATQRYSLGFYVSRGFTLFTSMLVLGLLLKEMTNLYLRLARSNAMLQREQGNKLMNLEAMASSISHEIRQPLLAMTANSAVAIDLIRREPPDLAEALAALRDLNDDVDRTAQVLESIRALFGRARRKPEAVDVNETALGALRILRAELGHHGVTARTDLTPALPRAIGDRIQLQEVMINLCHNAIEAMESAKAGHRLLTVRTRHDGENAIVVEVEDSGPGIAVGDTDRIFDAFVTTKPTGMGLGLAICRMIVDRHGGHLSAWPARPSGTIFRIVLPV